MSTHILVTTDGTTWPYDLGQLRRDNPNVSFSNYPSEEDLAPFNCYPVLPSEIPVYDQRTEQVEQTYPEQVDGTWYQAWRINSLSTEEIQRQTDSQAEAMRLERNQRLTSCDWTQIADAPVDAFIWAAYRQSLRDVPGQIGFPWDIDWPKSPS